MGCAPGRIASYVGTRARGQPGRMGSHSSGGGNCGRPRSEFETQGLRNELHDGSRRRLGRPSPHAGRHSKEGHDDEAPSLGRRERTRLSRRRSQHSIDRSGADTNAHGNADPDADTAKAATRAHAFGDAYADARGNSDPHARSSVMPRLEPHITPIRGDAGCGFNSGPGKAPSGEPGGYDAPVPPSDTPDGNPRPPKIDEPKSPHVDPAHPPRIEEPPRPRVDPRPAK